jgi:DNA-directed RNA polymerase specialized sigma24 family protein
MASAPKPNQQELRELRDELLTAARTRLRTSPSDAEDVTQEALIRLVTEDVRENAPPLRVRGRRALKLAVSDLFRARRRAKEPPLQPIDDLPSEPTARDAGLGLVDLEDVLLRLGGHDALAFATYKRARMTEADIARLPGWNVQRAGRARKRLRSIQERLEEELLDTTGED